MGEKFREPVGDKGCFTLTICLSRNLYVSRRRRKRKSRFAPFDCLLPAMAGQRPLSRPLLRRTLRALVSRCVVLRPSPLPRPFISPSSARRSTLSRLLFPFIPPQTGEAAVVYLPPRVEADTRIKINKNGRGKRRARSGYSGTAILMQRNLRPLSFARRTCVRKKKNGTRQLRKERGEEEDGSKNKKSNTADSRNKRAED